MRKYFEVVAKCGHVGRDRYYEGHFFIESSDASHAAQYVKSFPRVKRDHEDAILSINEIGKKAYERGVEQMQEDKYFQCHSKHEQNAYWEIIKLYVHDETEKQLRFRETKGIYRDDRVRCTKHKKGIRNPYKYAKYNTTYAIDDCDYDYDIA